MKNNLIYCGVFCCLISSSILAKGAAVNDPQPANNGQGSTTSAESANIYEAPFWTGEYPQGWQITKDLTLKGRNDSNQKQAANVECQLKKGTVLHNWAICDKNPKMKFMTRNVIVKYRVIKPFDIFPNPPETDNDEGDDDGEPVQPIKPVKVAKAEIIEQLTHLSEGFIRYRRVKTGEIFDAFLPDDSLNIFPNQEEKPEEAWLQVECENSVSVWFMMDDLGKIAAETIEEEGQIRPNEHKIDGISKAKLGNEISTVNEPLCPNCDSDKYHVE